MILLVFSMVALLLQTGFAAAERRVALVIGNSHYANASLNLINPKNDADDVAAALRGLGFEVLELTDADLSHSSKGLQQFAHMAEGSDAALFFYAGHALQYQGVNYLLPTDAEVANDLDLKIETVALDSVRTALDRSSGVKIMVLDACRNNPVAARLATIAGRGGSTAPAPPQGRTRGLQRIDKTEGLIVAYSTGADDVALDGQGRNSPFTAAFLKRLAEPGLEIEMMFRRISNDVSVATNGQQRPETYVSLVSEYYLNQTDRAAWDKIRNTDDPAQLRDFLARFPSSFYSLEARYRLTAIERAIDDAKQRAVREAEQRRRDQDAIAAQAAARLEAEKVCQASRTALNAIKPNDVAALRALLASAPCDAVKSATRNQLAAAEAQLAQEAEACHRDSAALGALGPRDLAGARALLARTACPDVKTDAQAHIAAIEAEFAKEADACRHDGATLAAIGARDLNAMRALKERTACADVKNAAQARISGVEADLAREAELCRRDGAGLAALAPRDLPGVRNLMQRTSCSDVRTAARNRIASIEADMAKEAETCRREDGEVKTLAKTADRAGIEALRQRAQCPATTASIDQALRAIAAAADAACARDNAALGAVGPRDPNALRELIGRMTCAAVKSSAEARLKTLETLLAREAETCRHDEDAWRGVRADNRADIEALRRTVGCPAVATAIDKRLAELKLACGRDADALAKIGTDDAGALRGFVAKATCSDIRTTAEARLAKLEAATARNAEICRRDDAQLKGLAPSADRPAVEALRKTIECPAVGAALDRKLAEMKLACGRDSDTLAKIGASDVDGLRNFLAKASCAGVKGTAQARLAELEATLAREAEICRGDAAEWAKLSKVDDRGTIETLRGKLHCPAVLAAIDRTLLDLNAACTRETAALNRLGPENADGVRDLLKTARCPDSKVAATARLAAIEAEAARRDEACRREDLQLSALQARGASARADLIKFERDLTCAKLRPSVHTAVEQLAALPPASASPAENAVPPGVPDKAVDAAARVRTAQKELRRLGCLEAAEGKDGELDARTDAALREYLTLKGHGLKKTTEVKITDDLLARLEEQKVHVCAKPPVVARPQPEQRPARQREENIARRPPPREERQRPVVERPRPQRERPVARRPPREERPTRQAAEPRQPPRAIQSSQQGAGSRGGAGGSGGGSTAIGVGF